MSNMPPLQLLIFLGKVINQGFHLKITVKGRNNYWRYTVYNWLLEIRDILTRELCDEIEVHIEDGNTEDPEIYIDDVFIGSGVVGEEGYLIEVVKSAAVRLRRSKCIDMEDNIAG